MQAVNPSRIRDARLIAEGMGARTMSNVATHAPNAVLVALALFFAPWAAHAYSNIPNASCGPGEVVRWRGGPSVWHLNEEGARDLPFEEVERILLEAFAMWSEPCCSGFRSSYGGPTKLRLQPPPLTQNVIFFEGERWPPEAGRSRGVIGVSIAWGSTGCIIPAGTIIFNEIDYRFTNTDKGLKSMDADLRWIAGHEIGHWLGLAHSEDPNSILRPRYTSDMPFLGLSDDDIEGVCFTYPGSCESCERSADCPEGSVCRDAECVASECRDSRDCAMGSICRDELCVPGCRLHDECAAGEGCLDGSCVQLGQRCEKHVDCDESEACVGRVCRQQPKECETCRPCLNDSDCGLYGACMVSGRQDLPTFCTSVCEVDRDCVGDAVCRQVPGAPRKFCLDEVVNPQTFCNAGYTCSVAEPGPELGCSLLGRDCTDGSFGCGGRADTCIDTDDGPKCSCTCRSDDECGPGARCLLDPSTDLPSCFPEDELSGCGENFCLRHESCVEGDCVVNPCFEVVCSEQESCVEGECVGDEPPKAKPAPKPKAKSSCSQDGGGLAWAGSLVFGFWSVSRWGRRRRGSVRAS